MNCITALISLQYHLREIASRDDIDGELASSLFETALEIDDFFTRNGLEATAIRNWWVPEPRESPLSDSN